MQCHNCGARISQSDTFCHVCGAPLTAAMHPAWPQAGYATPSPQQRLGADALTFGQALVTLLVATIPVIGFIMMVVWSFASGISSSQRNLARALLVLWVVMSLFGLVIYVWTFLWMANP